MKSTHITSTMRIAVLVFAGMFGGLTINVQAQFKTVDDKAARPAATPPQTAKPAAPVADDAAVDEPQIVKQAAPDAEENGDQTTPTDAESQLGTDVPPTRKKQDAFDDVRLKPNRDNITDEEDAAIVTYYRSFMSTYRLGPEDVVSIEVFGQPRYSRTAVVVPPDGVISMPHIRGGISVVGRTREEVARDIEKKYDEYIIEPSVTVSLDKAGSARYTVVGNVGQPGVKIMSHRVSVREAVNEAGGVTKDGSKKVFVVSGKPDGSVEQIRIDLAKIEKGKATDNYFLRPGDQVVVPSNTLSKIKSYTELFSIVNFARIFTGGF
ncbi:MAG: polysaccharide export protein [Pyrinomonadaceae bacterium MAG19_C2-C3]|nr:polysaccharide export protein [Pyrinomonadaceae bacterium MAG19_C2-C3]